MRTIASATRASTAVATAVTVTTLAAIFAPATLATLATGLFCQPPGTIWPSSRAGFSFSKHTPQSQRVKTHT